jgi:hypothetical protein
MSRREVTYDGVSFAPGARFRVVGAGAYLDGLQPFGSHAGAWSGWKQELHVGDIITCTGFGPGFGSDPGYGVEFTTEKAKADNAIHCDFRPMTGGMWNYHPFPGYLIPVPDRAAPESVDTAEASFVEERGSNG